MQIFSSAPAMQRLALRWEKRGVRVGFVPTMGYLHAGHLSLIKRARRIVGRRGRVVVSIYVNPTQFGPREDFSRYPRDLNRDLKLCRAAGTDVVFAPTDAQMYGNATGGGYSTYVVEEELSQGMEGLARPGHFRGVTTVVAKLLNLVRPDVAVFGSKDFQQAAVLRRMARDLNFPVRIVLAPTVREADGLAMSSRNKHLSPKERSQAVVLARMIERARQCVSTGAAVTARALRRQVNQVLAGYPDARGDYVEFIDAETLEPVSTVKRGTRMALAVFVGKTRLIDNATL